MSGRRIITLEQFIIEREKEFPHARGEFSQILRDIGLAARIVNREVNRAGLVDILGDHGAENVQGEQQKKLDVFANDHFIKALSMGGEVCVIGSEENDDVIPVATTRGQYVVLMDPLDGSSNIDVNVSIGTIFSIYLRKDGSGPGTLADCLQPGLKQVAAGYVIYGSSTILVYTTGKGVNGFTLDLSLGEFFLSHPNIRMPQKSNYYSLNESKWDEFLPGIRDYLVDLKKRNAAAEKPIAPRYIGSLVADFHRNLLKGGIFLYPGSTYKPEGKLRLMYECNPIAFIAEQAGGVASNGSARILQIQPTKLHQRSPLFVGSADEMGTLHKFLKTEQFATLAV
jgi:fructose-1,6-bisphosphatase I